MRIEGNIVDIYNRTIFFGAISIKHGKITVIEQINNTAAAGVPFICPGFIDAHIHIESSMVLPSSFAHVAVKHGTVATISDPHEIANVCGIEGVYYMIENSKQVPFKFHFGAPSCVPATNFETAGAILDVKAVTTLLQSNDIYYLSEMMNYPGVLFNDKEVHEKINVAHNIGKPIDGHAPGLRGSNAQQYISYGISTDHECFTYDEALEKLQYGMKIIIREGSAAKNFDVLIPLLEAHYNNIMFCSDDKHPDNLLTGHINTLCARAVAKGYDVFKVLQAACINPIKHYNMEVGSLQLNDAADFIFLENLVDFKVLATYINGEVVYEKNTSLIKHIDCSPINNFNINPLLITDLLLPYNNEETIPVIEALDGQLITNTFFTKPYIVNDCIVSNIQEDVLKLVVVNRYSQQKPAISFIKNIGITKGAFASTVAHDSHNIIAVGVDDESLLTAINELILHKGGLSVADGNEVIVQPLRVAGLMSTEPVASVAATYEALDRKVKALGSNLQAPFMTLSFMALLVIPHIKLSDKGLFDADNFSFITTV
jgi:adenine deaminase